MTVELLEDFYSISARFNIQTSINGFQEKHWAKHAPFFHSIALRYYPQNNERFEAEPGADPCGSYTVTDSANAARGIEGEYDTILSTEPGIAGKASIRASWTN